MSEAAPAPAPVDASVAPAPVAEAPAAAPVEEKKEAVVEEHKAAESAPPAAETKVEVKEEKKAIAIDTASARAVNSTTPNPGTPTPPCDVKPADAWKKLTDEKDPTNWIILGFNTAQRLVTFHLGNGGLEELKTHFDAAQVNVAAIKVVGVDQQTNVTSKRAKYVAVYYIGNKVPALRKGLIMRNKTEIERIFNGAACTMQASDEPCPPPSITMKTVAKKLLASGGAHKPVFYDFGAGETIQLKDLYERD